MRERRRVAGLLCLWLFVLVCGCKGKDPLGRHSISGSVTLDGAPLEQGSISFQPIEGATTSSGGMITQGKYSIQREAGLPAGKYLVQINGVASGTGTPADPNAMPGESPPAKELIPPEWNVDSKEVVEVKNDGPFEFKFDIKSKK